MKKQADKTMVFGVFDLLHPGHLNFLYRARSRGRELIAVIARDESVRRLEGRLPEWGERKRMMAVLETGLATRAVLGDLRQGSYGVIKKEKPDLICLGYDQAAFTDKLEEACSALGLSATIVRIGAHKPDTYKSSLLDRHEAPDRDVQPRQSR